MSRFILALDQGTSSSRALLFDEAAELVASHAETFACDYPRAGWVEQDPEELWRTQRLAIQAVLAKTGIAANDLLAIGITNQRETVVAWDRESGEPLHHAIVWQCRRTADYCDGLKSRGLQDELRQRTGLLADPYFSGTKMRWLLDHVPAVRDAAKRNRLAFGTVDSWLLWKLSGGRVHATDASNASRTLLYNIRNRDWDPFLLQLFGVPRESLPDVHPSSGLVAYADAAILGAEIPISGIAGDQQAALFGQCCFEPGMAKNTYGTGCFLLANTGAEAPLSKHGLLTTVAWQIGGTTTYALEGAVFIAGALIQWLRDNLGLMAAAGDSEAMARSVDGNGGVYIVPAFVGLGAPHWDPHARGLITGLTRGSSRNHIVRAALEAVAYQNVDLVRAVEADTGIALRELRIDGGMAVNDFLCQFQADVLGLPVSRPRLVESTALGAALLAGLGSGQWHSTAEIAGLWREARRFDTQMPRERAEECLMGWERAVAQARLKTPLPWV